ncbi:hypothetical protein FKW77_006856 [Venturia effusa]|uniref:Ricin B lectin domain-containing protein n=1 Tax=Venturia effusa TaxID=50376 RepID=A0A517LDZ7_9PEZI|nr:hypothetical protein FKW77_006856 [Venturia effusa]
MSNRFDLKAADHSRGEALVNHTQFSSTESMIDTPASTRSSDPPNMTETSSTSTSSSVPWQGCTYIIRHSKTGEVLTLLDGQVILEKPGGRGHIKWDCVDTGGWLGFKSPISGKYISQHRDGLICAVDHHSWCEHFVARSNPEGGYLLLMRQGGKLFDFFGGDLRVLGLEVVDGKKKVAKVDEGGIVWDFVKV